MNHLFQKILAALVFVTPATIIWLPHAGSRVFIAFVLMGLIRPFFIRSTQPLQKWEKSLLFTFAGFALVTTLCHSINVLTGNHPDPHWKIDNQLRWLGFIPIYFLFRTIVLPEKLLWAAFHVGAISSGFFGLIFGPGGHIIFGNLSLLFAFISLLALPRNNVRLGAATLIPVIAFVLGLTGSVLSESRGGWIAIPVFLAILYWKFLSKKKPTFQLSVAALFLVTAGTLIFAPQSPFLPRTKLAIDEVRNYFQGDPKAIESSVGARLQMWECGWKIYKKNPLLGSGVKSFEAERNILIDTGEAPRPSTEYWRSFTHPHNTYLGALTENGIPGILILLAVLLFPLWIFFKNRTSNISWAGIIIILGYLIFGLTGHPFAQSKYATFYLVIMALLITRVDGANTPEKPLPEK